MEIFGFLAKLFALLRNLLADRFIHRRNIDPNDFPINHRINAKIGRFNAFGNRIDVAWIKGGDKNLASFRNVDVAQLL